MTKKDRSRKISTGPNARPKDETIAQSGGGIPDDTGAGNSDIAEEAANAAEADRLFKRPGGQRKAAEPGKGKDEEPVEGDRETIERELRRQSDKQRKG